MPDFISPNDPKLFGRTDSETIAAAIREACETGLRKVKIPRYNARTGKNEWRISRAIALPDEFTVLLDNCYMVQETGCYDRMFCNSRAEDFPHSPETEQHDIAVIGEGNVILDGGEHNHLTERNAEQFGMPPIRFNNMFCWINVRGLRVENVHIRNQRWWAMNHYWCSDVVLKNINFFADPHVPNMDGIDLRIGCHDFTIENITGRTGDDLVAFTAIATEKIAPRMHGKDRDIHDCTLRNLKGDPWIASLFRLLNQDGSRIYNITADTVMDAAPFTNKKRSSCAIWLGSTLYYRERPARPEEMHHVTVKNVTSKGQRAVYLQGTSAGVTIENLHTYSDILSLVASAGPDAEPYEVRDLRIRHAYHAPGVTPNNLSGFIGRQAGKSTVCDLAGLTGSILLEDVHSDNAGLKGQGTAVRVSEKELKAEFKDAEFRNIAKLCAAPAGCGISLNGRRITGEEAE